MKMKYATMPGGLSKSESIAERFPISPTERSNSVCRIINITRLTRASVGIAYSERCVGSDDRNEESI
jgi:hypothetical protein